MPTFPTLRETYTAQQVTEVFRGYNHNMKIEDGEFFDMENLTSSYYPLLACRERRGIVSHMESPTGLLAKAKLAMIDGDRLIYGGEDITGPLRLADDGRPKSLVSMGAYLLIFPDRLYINTEKPSDCGSLDAHVKTAENAAVSYRICKEDGTVYHTPIVGSTAPDNPGNGDLWVDTAAPLHVLKQFSAASGMWTDIPTVYTRIDSPGIGAGFARYDGVTISGCASDDTALAGQMEALCGSKILYGVGEDYLVVVGLLDRSTVQTDGTVTVRREAPDMDFVTEAENRLWGCKYGLVDGKPVNEIYACALGDFKNWSQFLGLSTDSYAASVGTDGPWTGAVTHLGYPLFFKENCMHKVYISATGAHQIADTACRGVQSGSHKSLVVVNERLYYKGVSDICVYDGSQPVSVSQALGTQRYFDAVGGCRGDKYYVSMRDSANRWHLLVLDTAKGFWHREDSTRALAFAACGGELYYLDGDTRALVCVSGREGEPEGPVRWMAETGLMGYNTVEQKYIGRFNLRMMLPIGSAADLYIQYDSSGEWESAGHIEGTGTRSFVLPVRPRRCDHFRLRLEGRGDVRIYSFAKTLEAGSDVL